MWYFGFFPYIDLVLFWQNDLISNVLEAYRCWIGENFFGIIYRFHLI